MADTRRWVWLGGIVLLCVFVFLLHSILTPFLVALLLAYLFDPVVDRLEKAGDRNAVSFSEETIEIIFTYSKGIPRLINIICDFILLAAFAEETKTIDAALVLDIIGDLDFEYHYWGSESLDGHVTMESRIDGKSTATLPEPALSAMIKDINNRLDNLGKQSGSDSQKMLQDMAAKISNLEKSLKSQQEKSGDLVRDSYDSTPISENKKTGEYASEENAQSFMGNMFGRMFKL